jgi:cytochrome c oxidase subunit 2
VRRGAIVRIAVIGIVVAILVSLVAVLIPWLPDSASKQMDRIEFVFWFATVISIGIFSLVMAVIIYSVWTFRTKSGDSADGPSIHGNTGLEIAWTIGPAILVIAIGVLSAVVLSQNGDAGTKPLAVKVFAQQFAWKFAYPDNGNVRSGELVLPVDRTIQFDMTSADVIHSFWIPEMGQKQDLVPGLETKIVITPTRTGTFTLVCTELCGLGHATMRASVRVLSGSGFAAWIEDQKNGGSKGDPGAAVFASSGCGGCHTFAPAGSKGQIGPNLDNLAADAKKAGEDPEAYVKESIVNPNKVIVSGFSPGVMPGTYGDSLSSADLDALVTYLLSGSK